MNSYFPVHGHCHYSFKDNIVTIDAQGPFNLEFFIEMHNDLEKFVYEYANFKNFAILLIMRGNTLALIDAVKYHETRVERGTARAIAVNLSHSECAAATETQMGAAYDNAGLNNAFFEDLTQAKQWLLSQLD